MKVFVTHQGGGVDHPYLAQLVGSLRQIPGLEIFFVCPGSFTLWRTVRRYGLPDVIHIQWQHPFFLGTRFDKLVLSTISLFVQVFFLRLRGVRFVWTVHELVRFGTPRAGWELFANRLLARVVDKMIVHCATAVPEVAAACNVHPDHLEVIPHAHHINHCPPATAREQARRELGLPEEGKAFLFLGHIKGYKGVAHLANEFIRLREENICLVIAGKPHGSAAASVKLIKKLAAKDARLHTRFDFIPDDEVARYHSACDVVVLPYTDSLTSGAAVMAASYGRAIIAPKLGCMGEYPESAAILYDPGSAEGLYQALQHSLTAPLAEMGRAARNYIEQFPWSLVARETYRVYKSVLGQTRSAASMAPLNVGNDTGSKSN